MARDVLPMPTAAREETPDHAVAALPTFRRLRDALRAAATFRDACRAREAAARRWGEPPLFFFHPPHQAALEADRPAPPSFPDPYTPAVARRFPEAAAAWHALPDLLDDADRTLGYVEVRNAARAVPGLTAAVADLAPDHPRAAELAALLAIPDDEVFLVIHPAAGAGWRVRVRGVADVGQFHVLLADAVTGDPGAGKLPGVRPGFAAVVAYRNTAADPDGPTPVAAARFQLFRPQAVRSDGTLPTGLAGSDHWLWNQRPLAGVPLIDGERVVLLGEPAVPAAWDAEPRFPGIPAAADVVETLPTAAVDVWLRGWAGAAPVRRPAAFNPAATRRVA